MCFLSNHKLIKFASYLSITVAIIILSTKFYGWTKTDSQSIFASLVDSLLDVTSSLINLIAVRICIQPPDRKHRFGHGKFEDLAVFSQSVFFFISGIFVLYSCIKGLLTGYAIVNQDEGIKVMLISIFLTVILWSYQTYVIRKTKSKIIEADRLHYFSDMLANIAVIFSITLSKKFWYMDSVIGIFIAFYVMYSAYLLIKCALKNLVDEEFDDHERAQIIEIISKYPEIKGLHDLKTRFAANKPFIQFHIEIDANMPLLKAHNLSDEIAAKIELIFKGAEIIIHYDPDCIYEPGRTPETIR